MSSVPGRETSSRCELSNPQDPFAKALRYSLAEVHVCERDQGVRGFVKPKLE